MTNNRAEGEESVLEEVISKWLTSDDSGDKFMLANQIRKLVKKRIERDIYNIEPPEARETELMINRILRIVRSNIDEL